MRPTRILAVTVSAVLGVALGIGAAIALDRQQVEDPLGLGVPMVNQDCQPGKALLLLASSDNENGLGPEAAAYPDARYLKTASSCDTAWRQAGKPAGAYVVYLGPMDRGAACAKAMTAGHRGDQVTMLASGTTDVVQCVCYVSYQKAPVLRQGATLSDLQVIYVHSLQELLIGMGRRPDVPITDAYDQQMVDQVRAFQEFAGRPANGVVDEGTWKALTGRGCENF